LGNIAQIQIATLQNPILPLKLGISEKMMGRETARVVPRAYSAIRINSGIKSS